MAQRIRDDGIDILVDVAGHTAGNRLQVFARKPAPVSLHWLDFGYTTGLSAIDYYLTDWPTVPAGQRSAVQRNPVAPGRSRHWSTVRPKAWAKSAPCRRCKRATSPLAA